MMAKTNPLFPTLQPLPLQPKVGMGTKTGHVWRHYTPPAMMVHGGEKTQIKEIQSAHSKPDTELYLTQHLQALGKLVLVVGKKDLSM